ncbi:hypothetical protein EVJ58_g4452 [Rhodofomes roseus]|uniref:Uncharacterized protein n=1 Tax=Rhodofomes roseus TaxID=34475 RepID=A0A4Y9YKR1_9APHY|nr:hypothetical protein EVJ58_g4452 [Rhodofomes roseus]
MFPVSNAMNLQYMTTVDYGIQRSNSMYNNASSAVTIPMGRNALFWTTLNLVGDNGESVSQIKGNISNQTLLIGCTLGWEQSIVTLDAATRQPVGLTSATDVTRRPSACAIWEPALLIDSMGIDPLIDSASIPLSMSSLCVLMRRKQWAYMLVGSAQSAEYPTGIGGSGIAYEQGADSAL